ncbi:zinc-ribbon domain-containing protein [Olsenella uli]|uniref:zinc-ribbon domain-containing protein n=1 Tax=Olsenella uli TaxID=133926 RepID=UPI00195984C2|nr:zinc-ribbon domain-containing protein [Olsenella uli]MBM6676605.1 zinc-ribbon domain-containing protein [Olsenella uli]
MFCPRCGSRLPDGAKFCASCGARLGEKSAGPAPAPAPAPQPRKRRRAPVVAAVIALVALLAGGGVAAWWFLLRPEPVYVRTSSQPVWTNPQAIEDSALGDAMATNMETAVSVAPTRTTWSLKDLTIELSDRGATLSETNGGGERTTYSLDDKGNVTGATGAAGEWSETNVYDEQDRIVKSTSSEGNWAEYSYTDDGSCAIAYFDADGTRTSELSYDARGNRTSNVFYWRGGGMSGSYQYEDGFLSRYVLYNMDGSAELDTTFSLERDSRGRVTAISSPDGSWGYVDPPDLYFDRVCLEYDENGCVSRMYAPWASAEKKEEFRSQYGAVPNEDNVFDLHYEYRRIDEPTPHVRFKNRGNNA